MEARGRMSLFEHLPDSTPFIAASAAMSPRFSLQRILEAVIIGGISAAASLYVTVAVLDERVRNINQRMDRIEQQADIRVAGIQEDLRRIYALLVERGKK
jgi:hypothetical protein